MIRIDKSHLSVTVLNSSSTWSMFEDNMIPVFSSQHRKAVSLAGDKELLSPEIARRSHHGTMEADLSISSPDFSALPLVCHLHLPSKSSKPDLSQPTIPRPNCSAICCDLKDHHF